MQLHENSKQRKEYIDRLIAEAHKSKMNPNQNKIDEDFLLEKNVKPLSMDELSYESDENVPIDVEVKSETFYHKVQKPFR